MTNGERISVGRTISLAHALLTSNYGLFLGVAIVYLIIVAGIGAVCSLMDSLLVGNAWIQPVTIAGQTFVLTPLAVGPGMLAAMRFRRGPSGAGDFNTLAIGFTRYEVIVLIALIMGGVSLAMNVVNQLFATLTVQALGMAAILPILGMSLVMAVVLLYLGIRFWFATFIAIDPEGPRPDAIESLRLSWRMTQRRTLTLFLLGLVTALIFIACLIALLLPALFYGFPLATCVSGVAYALVAHEAGLIQLGQGDVCPNCDYPRDAYFEICPECGWQFPTGIPPTSPHAD